MSPPPPSGLRVAGLRAPVASLLLLAALTAPSAGQDLAPVPDLRSRVTDLTGTLQASQSSALETKLADFEAETGSQIAVLLVRTARPEAIEQYALRVAEAWRLGREGVDDGALLLVALEDRQVRIEVGYGLEGALTDATVNRIIEEAVIPHFLTGDMYGGLAAGVERMISVARGEPLPPPATPEPMEDPLAFVPLVFVMALVVGGVLSALFGRVAGALATGGLTGFVIFGLVGLLAASAAGGFFAFLLTLALGGARGGWTSHRRGGWGGGFGGFGGGLGRGGGFGGGGFGGFSGGGGGFGGGGASGSW